MNSEEMINKLEDLAERAIALDDLIQLEDIKRETYVLIKRYFGYDSDYLRQMGKVIFPLDEEGNKKVIEDTILRYLQITDTILSELKSSEKNENGSSRVFIVHGTDRKPVEELKEILSNVGLKPLVLEDLPGASNTIIEKLEKYSKVDFAFVILTPDDAAVPSESNLAWLTPLLSNKSGLDVSLQLATLFKRRARQNVILEFGYFIGRLKRNRVCCLYKGNIELPSDMHGICYLHFNESVNEVKDTIIGELKAANILPSYSMLS
ncbi:MAG: nucleotide-binding protein [Candidatus Bathyarchaeota archaeon]|nr:nucleotide-binding protein [Candidatus Bathyarchaeota archaeon]